jgi:nucleoside-diphosphate-sugar epimerase
VRILVTGSSGQVGAAIAARLLAAGHEVVGLGRRLTKGNRQLSGALAVDLGRVGVAKALATRQRRCDAIVHAAASLERDPFAPDVSLTNCLGTQQIVELATRWQVASFVYISSLPVIGLPSSSPVTEEHPVCPLTSYHASKLYGEQLVGLAEREGIPSVSLRLTAPAGPGTPDGRIMTAFVRRALDGQPLLVAGKGTRGQDYVDVRDVAEAVMACIERTTRGLLNIGSGQCVTNLELARRCIEALGSTSEIRMTGSADPEDDVRWVVSIDRARSVIGYSPGRTLDESIAVIAQEQSSPVAHV